MLRASAYGGNEELAALRHELRVNIRMLLLREDEEPTWKNFFDVEEGWPTIRIALTYVSPQSTYNHYMSFRPCTPVHGDHEFESTVYKI